MLDMAKKIFNLKILYLNSVANIALNANNKKIIPMISGWSVTKKSCENGKIKFNVNK